MLNVLGLNKFQEQVYRQLVQLPSASVPQLAMKLHHEDSLVQSALGALEVLGLVACSVATPEHYIASPPELALGSLIAEQQQDIRRAELELHTLTDMFHKAAAGRMNTDIIDVVRGAQAVAQHFAQLQRGSRQEVCALVKSDVVAVDTEENTDEGAAILRGVDYKVVVESEAFNKPGFAHQAAETSAAGEQIRVTDTLPLRLLISDRKLALVPLRPEASANQEVGALLIRPSGLLDALCALFDLTWQRAQPIYDPLTGSSQAGAGLGIDELDQHLLVLLRAGITDKAISGQLGLSLRTVQRRLQLLMSRAEVTTRFQLGLAAAQRGWLS